MKKSKEDHEKEFLNMLKSISKEELAEFIRSKGKEPKLIRPFICLSNK